MVAQKLAHAGHSLVSLVLIEGRAVLLGILSHASELIDVERTTEAANPFLTEDGLSAVFALYGNIADKE